MGRILRAVVGALALAAALLPLPARAGDVTFTVVDSALQSPGKALGPWREADLDLRLTLPKDSPGLTLVTRGDADRLAPQSARYIRVDDYHQWTRTFSTYAAGALASGAIYARRSGFAEGDLVIVPRATLVAGLGAGVFVNADRSVTRQVVAGPTLYVKAGSASLRYIAQSQSYAPTSGTVVLALLTGKPGHETLNLTFQSGDQPQGVGIVNNTQALSGNQRAFATSVDARKWLSANGGARLTLDYARVVQRTDGAPLYIRRALGVGVFTKLGNK